VNRLPSLTGEDVIKALEKAGFKPIRQKGSHVYLQHPDGRATVVPVHKGESIGRGLLGAIIRDAEMSREDFLDLL
jgi:predicted RNA binding protein YcfA (HicA-like mRNA interferase family)